MSEHAKQQRILAKIHERIANRRSDFAHQASRKLVNTYQVIVFEDLAPLSKLCSSCGEFVPKTLGDRVHTCPHCGLVLDQGENAARNMLQRGPRSFRS